MTAPIRPANRSLTSEQQQIVKFSLAAKKSGLIIGGPGSGKTTALVACITALVQHGHALSEMVVLTASRAQAQELRSEIVAGLQTSQTGMQVTTIHGWCQQIITKYYAPGSAPRFLTAPQQEYRVRELLGALGTENWPSEYGAALTTRNFSRQIRRVLARARQHVFEPEDLTKLGEASGLAAWAATGRFFAEYLDVLDAEEALDYAELVYQCRLALLDESFHESILGNAKVILVDEFAEMDAGMINLLADFHAYGATVLAFADPDTRVFDFRGADPHAIRDFQRRFRTAAAKPVMLTLTRNLRATNGLEHAVARVCRALPETGIQHLPPEDQPIPGLLVVGCPDDASQARDIARRLITAHRVQGIAWSDMAVITHRNAGALTRLARRLATAGIPVKVMGDQLALSEELAVSYLIKAASVVVELANEAKVATERLMAIIRSPLTGLDDLELRRIGRLLRARYLEKEQQTPPGAADLLAVELVSQNLIAPDETDHGLAAIVRCREVLAGAVKETRKGADVATILWRLWQPSGWPERLFKLAIADGAEAAGANQDLDAVIALFDLAERQQDLAGRRGLRLLIDDVSRQQIAADTARESARNAPGVQVLTAHRAKGSQWAVVVVTDAEEGNWPKISAPIDLLQADRLGFDGLQDPPALAERIAAERRAFLLAISRASTQLIVSFVRSRDDQQLQASRFVRELGTEPIEADDDSLYPNANELVGLLRRIGCDPHSSPALRQAAAIELAWLAAQRDTSGRNLVAGADPLDWWELRDLSRAQAPIVEQQSITLTGSEVEMLLACPRRWFLTRQAKAERAKPRAATIGTQIHEVICKAQQEGLTGQAMIDLFFDRWNAEPASDGWRAKIDLAEAIAALRRYSAWAMLPEHAEVIGVEMPFDVRVESAGQPVRIIGSIDRLERTADGRIRVVDFKTGRRLPSAREVATMDQLGIYQLAVARGAFDDQAGGHRGSADAQLVYLKLDDGFGYPKWVGQPAIQADEEWVMAHLDQAASYLRNEYFPSHAQPSCSYCQFKAGCPSRNGGGER